MNATDTQQAQASPMPVQETAQVPAKKSNNKVLKIILIALLSFFVLIAVVVALIFGVVNSATKAPVKASNEFLTALDGSSAEAAYNLTSSEFQAAVTPANFVTFFDTYKAIPFADAKVTSKEVKTDATAGEVATIDYSVKSGSTTYTVETLVVKNGDAWKVLSIEVK